MGYYLATNKYFKHDITIDFYFNAFIWKYFGRKYHYDACIYINQGINAAWISYHVINFNFLGPIIAPILHCYFDIFSGCIQTLVFVTLSSILIMMENSDDDE